MRAKIFLYLVLCIILIFSLAPLIAFLHAAIVGLSEIEGNIGGIEIILEFLKQIPGSTIAKSLWFTIRQSFASTALAISLGLPGAWLAARFRFPGRKTLLSLAAIPFCFPPILIILAFICYYGKEGLLPTALSLVFGSRGEYRGILYSFWGLVIVHAFYNFPIVVHQISALLLRIPNTSFEAARTLGARKSKAFRTGILPWILPGIGQSAGLIFLYCFFSFTTVLVFGGRAGTTLEVEIYQALRYRSNLALAAVLSIIESACALLGIWMLTRMQSKTRRTVRDFGAAHKLAKPKGKQWFLIVLYEILIIVFFIGPLFSIVIEAFTVPASLNSPERFGVDNFKRLFTGFQAPLTGAILSTLKLSGIAALLATSIGILASFSAFLAQRIGKKSMLIDLLMDLLQWLPMAVSPAVLAYGWLFISANHIATYALIAAQALIAWPFVSRTVGASLRAIDFRIHEAAKTLGASPLRAFMTIELRTILPSVAAAAAFAFSITAGDVNVPLMLGMSEIETLPLLLYRLTAAYRFNEACAAGLVLGLMTGIVFMLKEKAVDVA